MLHARKPSDHRGRAPHPNPQMEGCRSECVNPTPASTPLARAHHGAPPMLKDLHGQRAANT
eukprot:14004813-Alexandrium_andersonii.AAC.1